ncbi:rRNA-binding ribosome biosynthesis protein utp25 [Thecaphora frezii]
MDPTVKLMTLINVSATRPGKRQRLAHHSHYDRITSKAAVASTSLLAKQMQQQQQQTPSSQQDSDDLAKQRPSADRLVGDQHADSDDETSENDDNHRHQKKSAGSKAEARPGAPADAFVTHFGSQGAHAHAIEKLAAPPSTDLTWSSTRQNLGPLGDVVVSRPQLDAFDPSLPAELPGNPQAKVLEAFEAYIAKRYTNGITPLQTTLAKKLASYVDVAHTEVSLDERPQLREVVAMHAMSHVAKTRRRILKNNEKLAKLASADAGAELTSDVRDQGFTRPRVLVLLPFRNSAKEWVNLLAKFSLCDQIDNKARFDSDFSLPEGTIDKLADASAYSRFPRDHVETFRGNIDDSFKLGIKVTRKSLKLYSAFYDSDVIVASPLGLRLIIEKERDSDFLSSIELLVADQMDVMSMQNWDHVQFVLSHLNQIPKQAHDTDFSRVKQWYLDGKAGLLRQSVVLSAYDFPELRAVVSKELRNVAGKLRTVRTHAQGTMAQVRPGIRQVFMRFDCANLHAEADLRFQQFTTKTFAQLQKSAVAASHTLVFVPSYFDFVRLDDWLRKQKGVSYVAISEYSSNKEILRARESFFSGRKSLLLITERFHFYRRYFIRGAKTLVFYDLPDHAAFFSEVLEFPFTRKTVLPASDDEKKRKRLEKLRQEEEEEEETDPSEVTVHALFSRYGYLKLERIVGDKEARRMVEGDKATWRFA